MRRALALLVPFVAFVAAVLFTGLELLSPSASPASIRPGRALAPRLARHLLFVVVDGLRYDVATNPELMPRFAEAMRTRASGEVWAGHVSMTSSAIMAFGTGQPGRVEQVVRNLNPAPPLHNTWLENARGAGLRLAFVGDPGWVDMYRASFVETRVDPAGVSIDADFNPQTFRDARALYALDPDFLVVHFVTPDHQGHAYGLQSRRYRDHIRGFDGDLARFLDELGPDWTVVVTSDHGASDSGTHGTDVSIQRRCPLYAYGRGIAARSGHGIFEQVDVAPTLATLLGVPAPAHGRGHVMTSLLDRTPAERARIACAGARNVLAYGSAAGLSSETVSQVGQALKPCVGDFAPAGAVAAAEAGVRRVDAELAEPARFEPGRGGLGVLFTLLSAWALAALLLGRPSRWLTLGALFVTALATYFVYVVERLPGMWPNALRSVLFLLLNGPLVLLLARPGKSHAFLERAGAYAAFLAPGALVVSYTPNTKAESFAVCLALALLFVLRGVPGGSLRAAAWSRDAWVLAGLGLILLPTGVVENDICPSWLRRHPLLEMAVAGLALVVWQWSRPLASWPRAGAPLGQSSDRASFARTSNALLSGLLVSALVARAYAPALLGRLLLVAAMASALYALRRGAWEYALGFSLVLTVLVARPFEAIFLVASLGVAKLSAGRFAEAARASRGSASGSGLDTAEVLLILTFGFALLFVQRVGVQNGIELGTLDFQAGAFGDPSVPAWLVVSSLLLKFMLIEGMTLGVLLGSLGAADRERIARAMIVVYVGRGAALLLQLYFCGQSYWTAFRLVADLPFALLAATAAILFYGGLHWRPRTE